MVNKEQKDSLTRVESWIARAQAAIADEQFLEAETALQAAARWAGRIQDEKSK